MEGQKGGGARWRKLSMRGKIDWRKEKVNGGKWKEWSS